MHTTRGPALPPFQWLLDEHAGTVLRFLTRHVGGTDAEDCFQETMLAALRAYPSLAHGTNLRGWLLTIARRKAVDSFRASGRRPLSLEDASGEIYGGWPHILSSLKSLLETGEPLKLTIPPEAVEQWQAAKGAA